MKIRKCTKQIDVEKVRTITEHCPMGSNIPLGCRSLRTIPEVLCRFYCFSPERFSSSKGQEEDQHCPCSIVQSTAQSFSISIRLNAVRSHKFTPSAPLASECCNAFERDSVALSNLIAFRRFPSDVLSSIIIYVTAYDTSERLWRNRTIDYALESS